MRHDGADASITQLAATNPGPDHIGRSRSVRNHRARLGEVSTGRGGVMGKRIAAIYDEAGKVGGLEAKIRLAALTRTTSMRALTEPDSPANIARFEAALASVRAEFLKAAAQHADAARRATASSPVAAKPALPGGEELLWGVLSSLHDAMIVVFGAGGSILLSYESRSLSKRFGAIAAGAVGEAIAKAIANAHASDIEAILAGGDARQAELAFTLEGSNAWLSVALSAVHDEAGKVKAVAGFVQDVTQRKESERRLLESEQRVRGHNRKYLELVAHESVFLGDVGETMRRVTEAASSTLGVARASVWLYDPEKTKIVCADLFEREGEKHSSGIELMAEQFPGYFAALRTERTIAANDAHTDERTSEFSAPYLAPLGINSMLDVPIWVNGDMVGVVCHEHVGPAREWTADEENFAYLMANFVALSKTMAKKS